MAINKFALIMVAVSLVLVSADPRPPAADDATRCFGLWLEVFPCDDFVTGINGTVAPSPICCSTASVLYAFPNRQLTCSCLKSFYGRSNITPAMRTNLAALPGRCGINIPYPITFDTDCSRIQ